MTRRYTPEKIKALAPGEVFVFGTNSQGFHGAGAAADACMGYWKIHEQKFLEAYRAPRGDPRKIGRWAVLGTSRGLMQGREGMSYGIETIIRPNMKRSVPLGEIEVQLEDLMAYASTREGLTFLVTKIGCNLAGYEEGEIREVLVRIYGRIGIPDNIVLPRELEVRPDLNHLDNLP